MERALAWRAWLFAGAERSSTISSHFHHTLFLFWTWGLHPLYGPIFKARTIFSNRSLLLITYCSSSRTSSNNGEGALLYSFGGNPFKNRMFVLQTRHTVIYFTMLKTSKQSIWKANKLTSSVPRLHLPQALSSHSILLITYFTQGYTSPLNTGKGSVSVSLCRCR